MKPWSVKSSVRRSVAAVGIIVVGILIGMPVASAGGWAVSTLDPMPAPVAGASTPVGFTIRQHGVSATNPEGEVGVAIRAASGSEQFFAASPEGAVGHYTAEVRFPEPGTYRWEIRQGWFAPQDLGPVDVGARAATAAAVGAQVGGTSGSEYRWPLSVRVLLPVLGLALGAFGVAEMVRTRRRGTPGPIAT